MVASLPLCPARRAPHARTMDFLKSALSPLMGSNGAIPDTLVSARVARASRDVSLTYHYGAETGRDWRNGGDRTAGLGVGMERIRRL